MIPLLALLLAATIRRSRIAARADPAEAERRRPSLAARRAANASASRHRAAASARRRWRSGCRPLAEPRRTAPRPIGRSPATPARWRSGEGARALDAALAAGTLPI
ncbi:MAG: hypothetical protein QM688_01600 [Sphingomonas bacterium]